MLNELKRFYVYTALFLTMVSLVPSSITYAADLSNLKAVHTQFATLYANDIENESLSGSSDTYYSTSYYLHGMLSTIEGTQDEALLQKTMYYIDNMVSKAVISGGHRVWGPLDSTGAPGQVNSFKGCGPIARAAAVIMNNPTFKAKYGAHAKRYIDFVDDSIIQYWHVKRYGTVIPWLPTDLGGWGTYTYWSQNASLLGQIAASLYAATRPAPTAQTPMYLDIATRIAQGFRRTLQPYGNGWIWNKGLDIESDNLAKMQDTSHANDDVRLLVFAYESGVVFTLSDILRMASTLNDTIWNSSATNPMFSNYIDGSNLAYRTHTEPGSVGIIYSGWALLGKYSSQAKMTSTYLLNAVIDGTQNASVAHNSSNYGKVALSGHLLRSSGAPVTPSQLPKPSAPINLVVKPAQ